MVRFSTPVDAAEAFVRAILRDGWIQVAQPWQAVQRGKAGVPLHRNGMVLCATIAHVFADWCERSDALAWDVAAEEMARVIARLIPSSRKLPGLTVGKVRGRGIAGLPLFPHEPT